MKQPSVRSCLSYDCFKADFIVIKVPIISIDHLDAKIDVTIGHTIFGSDFCFWSLLVCLLFMIQLIKTINLPNFIHYHCTLVT